MPLADWPVAWAWFSTGVAENSTRSCLPTVGTETVCLIIWWMFLSSKQRPRGQNPFSFELLKVYWTLNHFQMLWEAGIREREGERVREEKVGKSKSFRVQENSMGDLGGNVLCCLLGAFGSLVNREISGIPGFPIPHLSILKNQDAFLSLGSHLYNPSCTHYLSPMVE